jgi:hypothetical protein
MDKRLVRYAFDMKLNHYYRNIEYKHLYYKMIQGFPIANFIRVKVYNTKRKDTYHNHIWKWQHVVEVDEDDVLVRML